MNSKNNWVHAHDLPEEIINYVCKHLNSIGFVKELTKVQRETVAIAISIVRGQHIPLLDKYLEMIPEDKKFRR